MEHRGVNVPGILINYTGHNMLLHLYHYHGLKEQFNMVFEMVPTC